MSKSASRRCRASATRALTVRQEAQVAAAVRQVVPSDYWDVLCRRAFADGTVRLTDGPFGPDPAEDLRRRGVFPPGPGRADPSPTNTPMQPCESRACTCRRRGADYRYGGRRAWLYRHKHYPHYAIAGETPDVSDVEIEGVDECGQPQRIRVQGRTRREAYAASRAKGVYPTRLRVLRRGRRRRLCDDCRLALQEALAARERAKERREAAARAAASIEPPPELDYRGRELVPELELTPYQAAMEALRLSGARLEESKLPTEDEAVLKAQIERYLAGKRTSLVVRFRE